MLLRMADRPVFLNQAAAKDPASPGELMRPPEQDPSYVQGVPAGGPNLADALGAPNAVSGQPSRLGGYTCDPTNPPLPMGAEEGRTQPPSGGRR